MDANWIDEQLELCDELRNESWKADGSNVVAEHNGAIVAQCGGEEFWSDFPEVAMFIAAARSGYPRALRLLKAALFIVETARETLRLGREQVLAVDREFGTNLAEQHQCPLLTAALEAFDKETTGG